MFVLVCIELLEIVIIVNEVDLDAGGVHRGHLHQERMVGVGNRDVHAAEAYHFMKLIAPLVDIAEIGHESADLILAPLQSLGERAACLGVFRSVDIRSYLLGDKNNPVCHFKKIYGNLRQARRARSPDSIRKFTKKIQHIEAAPRRALLLLWF